MIEHLPATRRMVGPQAALRRLIRIGASVLAAALLAGCGKSEPQKPAAPPPVAVKVVSSRSETVPVVNEYLGRIAAYRSVEVRTRVEGILEKRHYVEGQQVERGQLLYTIDSAPYQAALNDARAAIARAEASLANARSRERRLAPLVRENAISRQDYDDAVTAVKEGEALLAAARAGIERAQLNLGYTRVVATERGRIGAALVPEGRLVGRGEATHLATIDRLDQVYVTFTMADREAILLRRALASGEIREADGGSQARIFLPDGTEFERVGRIDFTDANVNPGTGTINLRAVMPNPGDRLLLPGMFVRVQFTAAKRPDTILIPQQAVTRTPTGHVAWIVGKDGKAERRDLVVGQWFKDDWIVEQGLGVGEPVIVEGLQRLQPGAAVLASPWERGVAGRPGTGAAGAGSGLAPAAKH
jgi:membrane fusion protein, multidrug efflux system